jgi:hypothetical protein
MSYRKVLLFIINRMGASKAVGIIVICLLLIAAGFYFGRTINGREFVISKSIKEIFGGSEVKPIYEIDLAEVKENTVSILESDKRMNGVVKPSFQEGSESSYESSAPKSFGKILISEVMAGSSKSSNDEFIEIYNPSREPVVLTDWYLKKKTSNGSESTLVATLRLNGKVILGEKYFLIANDGGYAGSVPADARWASSNNIAYTKNSVFIYNPNGEKVDEVFWDEIVKDKSYARVSWDSNQFMIQEIPSPQNSGK